MDQYRLLCRCRECEATFRVTHRVSDEDFSDTCDMSACPMCGSSEECWELVSTEQWLAARFNSTVSIVPAKSLFETGRPKSGRLLDANCV